MRQTIKEKRIKQYTTDIECGFFKKYEYVYDEFYDCYLCPNDKILKYSATNRELV